MSRNSEFTYDPTKSGPPIPDRSEKLTFQPSSSLETAYTPDPTNLPDTYRVTEGPTFAQKAAQEVSENVEALSHAQKSSGTTRRQNRAIDASKQLQKAKIYNSAVAAERAAKEVRNTLRKGAYTNTNEEYVAGEKNDVYTPTYTQKEKEIRRTYYTKPGELSTADKEKIKRREKVEEAASTRFDKSPSKSTGEWATIPTPREIDLAFEGGHINKGERDLYYEDYHSAVNKLAEPRIKQKKKQLEKEEVARKAAEAEAAKPSPEEAEYQRKVDLYIPPKFKPPGRVDNPKLEDWQNKKEHSLRVSTARAKHKEEVYYPWLEERTKGMNIDEIAQFKLDQKKFAQSHAEKLRAERKASKASLEDDTLDPSFMPYIPQRTREGYVGRQTPEGLRPVLSFGKDTLFPGQEYLGEAEKPAVAVPFEKLFSDEKPGKVLGQSRIPKSQPKEAPTGEPVYAIDQPPMHGQDILRRIDAVNKSREQRNAPLVSLEPPSTVLESGQPAAYTATVNGRKFSYDNPEVGKPRVLRHVDKSLPNVNVVAKKDILELDENGQLKSVRTDRPAVGVPRDYLQIPKRGESTTSGTLFPQELVADSTDKYDTSGVVVPNMPMGPEKVFKHPAGEGGLVTEGTKDLGGGYVIAPSVPENERGRSFGVLRSHPGILTGENVLRPGPKTLKTAQQSSKRSARRKEEYNARVDTVEAQRARHVLDYAAQTLGHNDINKVSAEDLISFGWEPEQAKNVIDTHEASKWLEQASSTSSAMRRTADQEEASAMRGKALSAARKINWHDENAENFKKIDLDYKHNPRTGHVTISDPLEIDEETGKPTVIYKGHLGSAVGFNFNSAQQGEIGTGDDDFSEAIGNYRVMVNKIKSGLSDFAFKTTGQREDVPLSSILSYGREIGHLPSKNKAYARKKSQSAKNPVSLLDYITSLHNVVAINKGSRMVSPQQTVPETDTSGTPLYSPEGEALTKRVEGPARTKSGQPTYTVPLDKKTGKPTGRPRLDIERYDPETGKYPTVKKSELEDFSSRGRGLAADYALRDILEHHGQVMAQAPGKRAAAKEAAELASADWQKRKEEAEAAGLPIPRNPNDKGKVKKSTALGTERAPREKVIETLKSKPSVEEPVLTQEIPESAIPVTTKQKQKSKKEESAAKRAKKAEQKESEKRSRSKAPKTSTEQKRPPAKPKANLNATFIPAEEPKA